MTSCCLTLDIGFMLVLCFSKSQLLQPQKLITKIAKLLCFINLSISGLRSSTQCGSVSVPASLVFLVIPDTWNAAHKLRSCNGCKPRCTAVQPMSFTASATFIDPDACLYSKRTCDVDCPSKVDEEEEEFYKLLPANKADHLCQLWQSCSDLHKIQTVYDIDSG